MKKTGGEIIVDCLEQEGVEIIFGYPGGVLLPIYDVLFDSKIRLIMPRHEQAAAHAADGYARSTGKVGVCIATSGPGATNLVTGIATANMDSVPLIAMTGQVPTSMLGGDSFQEADIYGVTIPITKYNYIVKDPADLPKVFKEAFHLARSGRPGPVLIDLPKDVTANSVNYKGMPEIDLPTYKPTVQGNVSQIKVLAQAIKEAKQPVIYAGGGVIISDAHREIFKLAKITNIPVTTTLMGLGGFPETHELSLGMLGMHGTRYANYAVTNCDLLIALGARFDDRVTGKLSKFAVNAKIAHVDIDPAEIGKRVGVNIPIVGDLKNVITTLLEYVEPRKKDGWLKQIAQWKKQYPMDAKQNMRGKIQPGFVVEKIYELTKGEAIIATEVGQNQMWAAQSYKYTKPRTFLSSGGLGTMGYGFPAAIGAQFGNPDKIVFDIAGDGSFQMNIQELATAVQYQLPVKVAILNNCFLGMVRQWQQLFYDKRYSSVCMQSNPDFAKVAEAFGATGITVNKPSEVEPAIKRALETKGPVVLDFKIDREANVWPMVPAGGAINEMLGEEDS